VTGLIGIDPDGLAFEGEDLSGLLLGEPGARGPDPERPLWLQRPYYPNGHPRSDDRGWGFGVRIGPWKLIQDPGQQGAELYDLDRDPHEREDLAVARPGRVRDLSARLGGWSASQAGRAAERSEALDPEVREALEALGYGDTGP
jgi:hypothetical protein